MRKHSIYKGWTIIQHGRTHLRFSAKFGHVSLSGYKGDYLYSSLGEAQEGIDRRERRLQLILADPRL